MCEPSRRYGYVILNKNIHVLLQIHYILHLIFFKSFYASLYRLIAQLLYSNTEKLQKAKVYKLKLYSLLTYYVGISVTSLIRIAMFFLIG